MAQSKPRHAQPPLNGVPDATFSVITQTILKIQFLFSNGLLYYSKLNA